MRNLEFAEGGVAKSQEDVASLCGQLGDRIATRHAYEKSLAGKPLYIKSLIIASGKNEDGTFFALSQTSFTFDPAEAPGLMSQEPTSGTILHGMKGGEFISIPDVIAGKSYEDEQGRICYRKD